MILQFLKMRAKLAWNRMCQTLKERFAATPNKWDDFLGEVFLKEEHFDVFWSMLTGEAAELPPPPSPIEDPALWRPSSE
jgi:hypothetical protein